MMKPAARRFWNVENANVRSYNGVNSAHSCNASGKTHEYQSNRHRSYCRWAREREKVDLPHCERRGEALRAFLGSTQRRAVGLGGGQEARYERCSGTVEDGGQSYADVGYDD